MLVTSGQELCLKMPKIELLQKLVTRIFNQTQNRELVFVAALAAEK